MLLGCHRASSPSTVGPGPTLGEGGDGIGCPCSLSASGTTLLTCSPGPPRCSRPCRVPAPPSGCSTPRAVRWSRRPRPHRADVRLRHHPLRRHPPRPRRHLPGLRPGQPGLAGRRARGALRAERHRCRRPAVRAGRPRRRGLDRAGHARDRAVPGGHDRAAGAPPEDYVGAVEAIPRIVGYVEALWDAGLAYSLDDGTGDVYHDVAQAPGFGTESGYDEATMLRLSAERGGDPDRSGKRNGSTRWCGAVPGRGAELARPARGRRPAGLAHRVRRHRAGHDRHRLRRPGRWQRPGLPAPRVLRRPRRGAHRHQAVRPGLRARRDDRSGRGEDEQEPGQPGLRLPAARRGRGPDGDPAGAAVRALPHRPGLDAGPPRRGAAAAGHLAPRRVPAPGRPGRPGAGRGARAAGRRPGHPGRDRRRRRLGGGEPGRGPSGGAVPVAEATDDWDEQSPEVVRDLVDALLGIALAP